MARRGQGENVTTPLPQEARDALQSTVGCPARPSPSPFDVSAGPGPTGSVWLVWARCKREANGCDVARYDLDDPGERPVAAAARAGVGESAPSIWRRQIVFARHRTVGATFEASIMIAPVTGGAARSIAAVPATTCGVGLSDGCERRALRHVGSLALRGSRLLVASAVEAGIGICGPTPLRGAGPCSGRGHGPSTRTAASAAFPGSRSPRAAADERSAGPSRDRRAASRAGASRASRSAGSALRAVGRGR